MTVSEPGSGTSLARPRTNWLSPTDIAATGLSYLANRFNAEQDRWFLWSPVVLGAGIGSYFYLGQEPGWWLVALPLVIGFGIAFWVGSARALAFALSMAVGIAGMGMAVAKLRTNWVAAPKLEKKLGPVMVEGWVDTLEQRGSGRIAAQISVIRIERLAAEDTPARVQLTFSRGLAPARVGLAIKVLAKMRPPPRPVAPGAYDFARRAWFRQIGAYGYAIARPGLAAENQSGSRPWGAEAGAWIGGIRAAVAARIMEVVGENGGPVAAALLTGLRGGIPKSDMSAIRDAGLAHLLAISGLHMALMSGAAFWVVRILIASVPWLALRVVGKKWAAGVGILTAFVYFFLAGGSVATERAFIMVAVALIAVMVDRPVISLRNVSLAALIILLWKPENLIEAGFQMSFAAVVALTAYYEHVTGLKRRNDGEYTGAATLNVSGMVLKTLIGIAVTTVVASLATSPLAAFHFNRVAVFGLVSNLVAVPLVGFIVMPLGLLVLVLMPFGLDGPALTLMGMGTSALVDIARSVAEWPNAAALVASPPSMVIPILAFGGLWLCLWTKLWRYWGLVPIGFAFWLAGQNQMPDIYIDGEGRRIAIKTANGQLILSKDRGARYAASQWLRRNADPRDIKAATMTGSDGNPLDCDPRACFASLAGTSGRSYKFAYIRHAAAIEEDCRRADIVVAQIPLYNNCVGPAVVIDRFDLSALGAHAIGLGDQGPQVTSVAAMIGSRPWSRKRPAWAGQNRKPR